MKTKIKIIRIYKTVIDLNLVQIDIVYQTVQIKVEKLVGRGKLYYQKI